MVKLCSYKDIFGKPNEGIHSYRIFNIAIVDVLLTVLCSWFISHYFKLRFFNTLVILFLLGIIFHWLFCVNTTINKFVGLALT